jgi:hypothetical protein
MDTAVQFRSMETRPSITSMGMRYVMGEATRAAAATGAADIAKNGSMH